MPQEVDRNASIDHQKRAATYNKGGAICGFIAAVIAVAFPPLAPLAIVFAVASAGLWYQAGAENRSAAKAQAITDSFHQEEQEKQKKKLKAMHAHLQKLEQHQSMQQATTQNHSLMSQAHTLAGHAHLDGGSQTDLNHLQHDQDHATMVQQQNHDQERTIH